MAEVTVRVLREDHRKALAAFLDSRPDSHLFLRANLAKGRMDDEGKRHDGTWVGTVRDDGTVTSIAALFWNGVCMLQTPAHMDEILDTLAAAASREPIEMSGPTAQVERALLHGLVRDRSLKGRHDSSVLTLPLARLSVPQPLDTKAVDIRPPMGEELGLLAEWHAAFNEEIFGDPRSADADLKARQWIRTVHDERRDTVATVDDKPVSYCAITGSLDETINIGAVYTPPELRGRKYAQCVVAGLLRDAARDGIQYACLAVAKEDTTAQRVYAALGFEPAFDWSIARFFPS